MKSDWRPPVGTLLLAPGDIVLREVVAHFEGDGYGACIVVKRAADVGGWRAEVVTQSTWERMEFVIVRRTGS